MDDATQAEPLLPDPGEGNFMLAVRSGHVELAALINPDQIDNDAFLSRITAGLRDIIKAELLKPPRVIGVSPEIQAALAQAVAEFERNFVKVLDGLPGRLSQTGEEYIEVGSDGVRREGFLVKKFADAEDAISGWLTGVNGLIPPFPATLYWRFRPKIHFQPPVLTPPGATGIWLPPHEAGYFVYSRLLISDKPRNN